MSGGRQAWRGTSRQKGLEISGFISDGEDLNCRVGCKSWNNSFEGLVSKAPTLFAVRPFQEGASIIWQNVQDRSLCQQICS